MAKRAPTKTKKPAFTEAQKAGLKVLKDRGLYHPKNPRSLTPGAAKYAKSLLNKFGDVISGKASVVTASAKGQKGFKAAAKYHHADEIVGTVRVKGNKIIIPSQAGEHAYFSKKTGSVVVARKVGRDRYIRTPFPKRITTIESLRDQLRPGDRIAVPQFRGKRGVNWFNMDQSEFIKLWQQGSGGDDGRAPKRYDNVENYIQIFRMEGPSAPKAPKAEKPKTEKPKATKPRAKKAK